MCLCVVLHPLVGMWRVCFGSADLLQTLEVATARVYNWDVMQKRLEKAEGKGDEEGHDEKKGG